MKLETPRLILREWEETDIPDLVAELDDLAVSRWLALVPHPYTESHARQWIAHCKRLVAGGGERSDYEFAIERKVDGKLIGGTGLNGVSHSRGTAGGGIWIGTRHQGRGYGTEAFSERARFAFECLGLTRLENGFFPGNTASMEMQTRLGYQVRGTRVRAYRCMADGETKDEIVTELLREAWQAGTAAWRERLAHPGRVQLESPE